MPTDDPTETPIADAAAARAAAAKRAFFEYGMGFFLAGALVGGLAVQLVYMAIG